MLISKFSIPEIIFGHGSLAYIGKCARRLGGDRVFFVSDPGLEKAGWVERVFGILKEEGLNWVFFDHVTANPRDHQVSEGAALYVDNGCDVVIALGIFALFGIEVNLATIAAFLTIVGYSLNDTIVIFDRIRENLKLERRRSIFEIINLSVNQSLSRTLNTSITTFIPVIILFVFGGSVLRGFSLALLVGVIVGTYSSMYIANPILYVWTKKKAHSTKRS